ncbi:hypothetical protein HDU93_006995 [Gonapodya sp. JEL0774]|nr:hypothetical protein HDU93_006995 [Gonapodya sp. JEL0774]
MQSRYGFTSIAAAREVVSNFQSQNLPLDVLFLDIDYMSAFRDFTFDEKRFPQAEVRRFVEELNARGQKMILILDPGIKLEYGYGPFDRLLKAGCFVNNADGTGAIEVGKVWPEYVAYPDWFHPNATSWWTNEITSLVRAVGVNGIWIDM